MFRSGRLRRKIQIYRKVVVKNDYGALTETWSLWKTVRGDEMILRGREMIESKEDFDSIKSEFVVRNIHSIRDSDRIKYDGYLYKIDVMKPGYHRRYLTIRATRVNE